MASGGRKAFSLSKLPQSEPKQSRPRGFSDDQNEGEPMINSSQKNVPKEVRINNWDFADWRPNSASADSKRRKKSKGNPEREREQSLSLDSPPQRDKKPRTPSTIPRTKMGPTTPTSQKRALENLRSRMTFSETDDGSTDGEPNNERPLQNRRKNPPNFNRQDTKSTVEGATPNAVNRNNNRDDSIKDQGLDSNQIVGRLMQIRDYIKQANTMRETLNKSKEAQANKDDMDKLKKLVDNLKEQERGYMGLLQRMLALRDEGVLENGALLQALLPDLDNDDDDQKSESDDTVSVDLEEERTNSSSSRPYIEDKLGDTDEENESRRSSKESNTMDNTLVAQRNAQTAEWDFGVDALENMDSIPPGSLDKANELAALQQQQNLLKILADKQEQLRALQGRQDALMAMHKEAERKLTIAQTKENKAKAAAKTAHAAVLEISNDDPPPPEDPVSSTQAQLQQLLMMKQRLDMLKNASNEVNEEQEQVNEDVHTAEEEEEGRQQLQEKLEDLQGKKDRMNDLLKELQTLRTQRFDTLLQNEAEETNVGATASGSSSHVKLNEAMASLDQADSTAESAEQVLDMMDAQTKLEKLQEVKGRLDQLRGLVHYYKGVQTAGEADGGDGIDQSSLPGYSDYGDTESMENARRQPIDAEKIFHSRGNHPHLNALGGLPVPSSRRRPDLESQQSDEDNASVNESQMSSLGPWGDEPEIREKVRQLKSSKEKLQQLQDLVSMVQQSPEMAQTLPDNIVELAASTEGDRHRQTSGRPTEDRNISLSEGEVVNDSQSDKLPGTESLFTVKEQIKELSELKKERERLLSLQNQLKSLHDNFNPDDNEDSDERNDIEQKKRPQSEPGPVVTFASNDELYSKMRKQRMLREELRSKKKELEAIMKKDRNKRQYFKNQDNQSDTVSYSTDAFGASASADATMATWGGSTVDNLENITEDRDGRDEDNNDDDDAYPSDGIVQGEEEEEEENDSDNNTYTIEADARQRRAARSKSSPTQDVRPKTRKIASFPRSIAREDQPTTSRGKPLKKAIVRKTKLSKRTQQENYRSAEEIVRDVETGDSSRLDLIQQQVQQTYQLLQEQQHNNTLQSTLSPNTSGLTMGNSMRNNSGLYPDMLQQQMYQQQMMMSINQCYQQLNMQQMEMQNFQHHLQQMSVYIQDSHHHPANSTAEDHEHSRLTPLASSSAIPTSPNLPHQLSHPTARPAAFMLNPQFPLSFAPVDNSPSPRQHPSHKVTSSSPARNEIPQPRTNNLRPTPPPRVESYPQNSNLNNLLSADNQRDVRPKTNGYGNFKKSKDRRNVSPPEAYERSNHGNENIKSRNGNKSEAYRPGLSSGISGAGFSDTNSVNEALSARLGEPRNRDGDEGELSLFETLRETIYSEVATLISQNESRPHFLIELFRELQLLSSDYLRQRGLYALQELISKTLSAEDNSYNVRARWTELSGVGDNLTASELTPSESMFTSEDEVKEYCEKKRKGVLNRGGPLKNTEFDYMEQADNTSSLSTPSTGLVESPFANDSLGDTVIHLDKALERMREMELKEMEEGRLDEQSLQVVYNRVREARQAARSLEDQTRSLRNLEHGSQSSIPDIMYSRINSSQLDQQVKQIILEVIPVIKEHIDDVCSPQLLAYIKRLVLSLTRQNDSRQEFTSFFHRQLGSILHDSLARFEGRKVRECDEDLLDSMSDALYDELAFFRMMQDLNDTNLNNKSQSNQSSKNSSPQKSPLHRQIVNKPESDGNQSSSQETDEEDSQNNLRIQVTEEEDLGKDRDDELASEMPIQDADEKDHDTESPYKSSGLKIELAVSETKPFTRIGSDEDDDNDSDESHSAEDPSETAVSRDAKMSEPNIVDVNDIEIVAMVNGIQGEEDGNVTVDKPNNIDNDQTHLVNGNTESENDVTVDDLPSALNIPCPKDLEKKFAEEQDKVTGEKAILSSMEVPCSMELAGDGTALKDPDNFGK